MFFLLTGSCYYHLNQPSGNFASPNYPGCYPTDKYCTWLIEAPFGQYIYLHFASFHLEYGNAFCPWDFVEIFDGNSVYSTKIIRTCGQLAPWLMYSSGRFLLVKFYSDEIIMMPGFSAFYQAVSYSKRNIHFTSWNNCGCIEKMIKVLWTICEIERFQNRRGLRHWRLGNVYTMTEKWSLKQGDFSLTFNNYAKNIIIIHVCFHPWRAPQCVEFVISLYCLVP